MTRTFAVYIVVGLLNTAVGYSLFAFFIFLGMHYSLAVLVSTLLGILFNFKTIGTIVFKRNDNRRIFRFFVVYGITYLLNVGGLRVLKGLQLDMYRAGALMLAPMAIVSFYLLRTFVYNETAKGPLHAAD